jgi:hypothetical protein
MVPFTDAELTAYLDEALLPEAMAEIERAARDDAALVIRLAEIARRRDSAVHSLADIWRRHRLSCPTREQWTGYLRGELPAAEAGYYEFHVRVAGCRPCLANLEDLESDQGDPSAAQARRQKYFQSSAARLGGGQK